MMTATTAMHGAAGLRIAMVRVAWEAMRLQPRGRRHRVSTSFNSPPHHPAALRLVAVAVRGLVVPPSLPAALPEAPTGRSMRRVMPPCLIACGRAMAAQVAVEVMVMVTGLVPVLRWRSRPSVPGSGVPLTMPQAVQRISQRISQRTPLRCSTPPHR